MSELRFDPIKKHWVIIAGQRAKRPSEFQVTIETKGEVDCPFCPGHEHETPDAILTIPGQQQGSWAARLIPNKFPAVDLSGDPVGVVLPHHINREGRGRHEVMIESAFHSDRQAQYSTSHFASLLAIYQARLRLFKTKSNCLYSTLFTNVGYRGGATLSHPHSQIIGLPLVPNVIQTELDSAIEHKARHGSCLFCDIISDELDSSSRIVYANDDFAVIAPYASRFAYEFTIYPHNHIADFCDLDPAGIESTAKCLVRALSLMDKALANPDYNLILHTAPRNLPDGGGDGPNRAFHWHFEVIPRVSTQAGMEWGTGIHINSIPPEKAARVLSGSILR
jgi:UDPglucose--hexose-1-phosphate uridylyltransferase